ncbi:MAG: YceI family protein [Gemmatimonadaceae bacterium]
MRKSLVITSALLAAATAATAANAQSASVVRLRLDPGSELTIAGTSSMHDFHCKTDKINAYVDVDPGYTRDLTKVARPIVSVKVNIVARTLSCGNSTMDNNMYKTLKADQNPLIQYTLAGYDILDGTASPSSFAAKTTGTLVISGQQKTIDMKIKADRTADGKAIAQGEQDLKMSEFGITPPSFMFGRLKVGDEIKVKFTLKAGPELLAQLAAAYDVAGR